VLNDNPNNGTGFSALEDLTIYDGVTDIQLLTPPIALMDVTYLINGVDFKTYGVFVSESDGIVDNLAMKEPFTVPWDDYHGEVIDLSRPRYEAREITLSCFIQGVGKDEFLDRVQAFMAQFMRPGTQRLHVSVHSSKPLVYEVYCKETISLKKRWSDALMVGTFELKLREPQPVKRVLKFGGFGSGAGINLFNKNAVIDGREVLTDGTIAARADEAVSEYIPVQANIPYTLSGMPVNSTQARNIAVYAADKTTMLLRVSVSAGQSARSFNTGAGAAYVVITMTGRNASLKNYDTVKFELGSVATAYTPFGGGVTMTVTSSKVLDIYWGDGTSTKNVYGTNRTLSHPYADGGAAERYIIIAGVIEDITAFTTNAAVIWSKL
jgi:hypothetical protein